MNTKNIFQIVVLGFLMTQLGCTPKEDSRAMEINKDALMGSWRLIKSIEVGHEDTTNRRDGEAKYYIKHVTESHFTWIEYDKEREQLLGAGGGTYTIQGNTYTENIEFYFPPGANELGQAIPFSAKINDDGTWRHTGYAKLFEFDPETGDNVMFDSAIIDELWEKVDAPFAASPDLVGTWTLSSYRDATDSVRSDWPDFVGYLKLVTPNYFNWVQYNKEGDEMMALGGGTYTYDGEGSKYVENLSYIYPSDDQSKLQLPFDCTLENDLWYHKGTTWKMSGNQIYGDSTKIDEIWIKVDQESPDVQAMK